MEPDFWRRGRGLDIPPIMAVASGISYAERLACGAIETADERPAKAHDIFRWVDQARVAQ